MIQEESLVHRRRIRKTIEKAFIIRIIALALIACSGNWECAFINQKYGVTDDYKYEMGATLFSETATDLFDGEAFSYAFNTVDKSDWTGTRLDNPIINSVLWYLISCFMVWMTGTYYSIRILNVLLACLSIRYIYRFAEPVWGQEIAYKAIKIIAYLPYPIFFCCFGYKEEMVLFCTFYLLSHAVEYRYGKQINVFDSIKILLVAVVLLGLRSGISLILFAVCIIICLFCTPQKRTHLIINKVILLSLVFLVMVLVFSFFGDAIIYKFHAYIGRRTESNATISMLMINSVADVWKIPFSYMLSILMPIALFKNLESWSSLIGTINICMVPISVGAGLYPFFCKKNDKIVYFSTIGYYLIYIVSSLGIFRHYSSLLPLNIIYYSAFKVNANQGQKMIMYTGIISMVIALVAFYLT